MYKVGEISFINFLPLATKFAGFPYPCSWLKAPPSVLNNECRRGGIDISPISFFAYADLEKEYEILPNFCIASDGQVMSVKLFSRHEISQLGGKKIFLTPDSESSIGALRAVCLGRYGFDPRDSACRNIDDADAVFLIGDKALAFNGGFEHIYDLGDLWQKSFNIPLVFSSIIVKREIFTKVKDALSRHYDANLREFESRRAHYCGLAAARLNSPSFTDKDADDYFSRLIYKISDEAFEKSREILHGFNA